jgi:hypothetical protein
MPLQEQDSRARRFCLRRVNPFLGLVAVVRSDAGRALSMDGRHWQIQVLANPPRGLWSGNGYQDEMRYIRFGIWSEADGLGRVPLNPILDVGPMLAVTEELVEEVRAAIPKLPFPLAPEIELWLLDQDRRPLALLATAIEDTDLERATPSEWSAGGRGDRPFVSPSLTAVGVAADDGSGGRLHSEALERLIQTTAGRRLNRRWFRRGPGGSGEGLELGAPEGLAGRGVPGDWFPALPVRTDWPRENDRRLVGDYVDWLSPYLLTLPTLDVETRRRLEGQAARHTLLVDALWRLYPSVLDPHLLKRVRVEAKLRRGNR